jgi:hypothetical protein
MTIQNVDRLWSIIAIDRVDVSAVSSFRIARQPILRCGDLWVSIARE